MLLIPDATDHLEAIPTSHMILDSLDVFTDGAAIDSKLPVVRLVSWGVVLAGLATDDPAQPIALGGVPGLLQTVGRAELCGIIAALKFAYRSGRQVRIWCDNEYVVKTARRILRGRLVPHALMPDHDLWAVVAQLVGINSLVAFIHVGSHQTRDHIDDFHQWAFDNNDQADALAGRFREWCSPELLDAQSKASKAYRRRKELKQMAHQHYVKVAEFAVTHKAAKEPRVAVSPTADPQLVAVDVSLVARTVPFEAPSRLRFEGWIKVVTWMEALVDPQADVQWISLAEILWSFQLHSGCRGVLSTGSHCTWKLDDLRNEYDGQQAIRSFGKYFVHLLQTKFPQVKTISRRPRNFRFQMWTMCLPLRFSPTLQGRVHSWLVTQLNERLLYTIGRDISNLPPATDLTPQATSGGILRFLSAV